MLEADVVIKKTEPLPDRWCEGAKHHVPEDAEFQGKPTSFFRVVAKGIDMVICEPCLVVAQAMAAEKKRRMRDGGSTR